MNLLELKHFVSKERKNDNMGVFSHKAKYLCTAEYLSYHYKDNKENQFEILIWCIKESKRMQFLLLLSDGLCLYKNTIFDNILQFKE